MSLAVLATSRKCCFQQTMSLHAATSVDMTPSYHECLPTHAPFIERLSTDHPLGNKTSSICWILFLYPTILFFYYTYHYNYLIFLFFKLMCLLLFSSQAERMQKKCMFDFYSVFRTYVCFSTCTVGTLSNVEYEHESVRYKQGIHLIVQ